MSRQLQAELEHYYPHNFKIIDNKFILKPPVQLPKHWQLLLKRAAVRNQKGICICGRKLVSDAQLHHALISRNDVRSKPISSVFIHHTYNVIALHEHCHRQINRAKSFEFLSKLYGNNVEIWYKKHSEAIQVRNNNKL